MGGRGGITSIYLRGADQNFTLLMLDGIPCTIPRTNELDSAITKGWESTLQLSPKGPVTFRAILTYLSTHVTEKGDALRNRPKWRNGLGLTIQVSPTVSLSNGRITFVSSQLAYQIPTHTICVGGYTKAESTLTYGPVLNWRWHAVKNASY